jgi:integrase
MPSSTVPYRLRGLRGWGAAQAEPSRKTGVPTFGVFAEAWMARQHELAEGGLLRINNLGRYKTALQAHLLPFFAARTLDSITREQCDDFRIAAAASGRLNPSSVNNYVELLGLILRAAHRAGLIERDPLSGMRPLRAAVRLVDPYDRSEVRRLIDATAPSYRLLVGLAALAGLRQGEAFAIRPADIDRAGHCLRVTRSLQRHHPDFSIRQRLGAPKTALGYREVPLQAELAILVESHLAEHWKPNPYDLLCPSPLGLPHPPTTFYVKAFLPAIQAAGLRHTRYHDLRRSFVHQCVEAGVPVAQTAAWLGHTIRMTELYYQASHAQLINSVASLDDSAQRYRQFVEQ